MRRVHSLNLTKDAHDFVRTLEAKQFKQVVGKILNLLHDPAPADSSALKGYEDLYRADIGEYRVVYRFDEKSVSVLVVDRRNDDQVYKKLARKKV
jgi:mRNA interferase RelE/StbE